MNVKTNLLHVAFQLMHSALVQVTAEESEQVWGHEERLHQWTLGQLSRHLEYCVGPKRQQEHQDVKNKDVKIISHHGILVLKSPPALKVSDAGLKRNTWGQQLLSLGQESVQQGQSKLKGN